MTTYQDQISENLTTAAARELWAGASESTRNEFVDVLLTDGLDAAVAAVEDAASEPTCSPGYEGLTAEQAAIGYRM